MPSSLSSPAPASAPGRRDAPRSLADDLRSRPDGELVELLLARTDLAVPVPTDLGSLAVRATTRASVQRVLDQLDAPALQVVEALAVLPEPVTPTAVSRAWGADARAHLARLRTLGLVWGTPRALRLVRVAREVLGPFPAGLGPPLAQTLERRSPARLAALAQRLGLGEIGDPVRAAEQVAEVFADPARLEALLADAPDGSREVLDRLSWGTPVGEHPGGVDDEGPVGWLLRHGLLAVPEPGLVVLPREVALTLRGGRTHREPATDLPAVVGEPVRPGTAEHAAAGSASEAVRLVAELLGVAERTTLTVRRAGGLGVRELRRVAVALDVAEPVAALVAELAAAAGLLAADGEEQPAWVPTLTADDWLEEPVHVRWVALAAAWLASDVVASLVGTRDRSGTVRAALSDDVRRPSSVRLRHDLLVELAEVPEDRAARREELLARLDHRSPRRAGPGRDDLVTRLLHEAAWLGLTGQGVLAPPARALLAEDTAAAAERLGALLPEPVDHLLLQADLTAVAPGPLTRDLAAHVELAADVESRGTATVYRFTADSVRRALDAGRTADELLAVLEEASPNGVPQPLSYLVRDVARRHGLVRVGHASSFLRAEDPAALEELLVDRRLAGLALRRLAPTVLASPAEGPVVLETLRRIGLAPAAEAADGTLLVPGRSTRRTSPRRRRPGTAATPRPPSAGELADAVARWRLAESGPRPGSVDLPFLEPRVSLEVLRDAVTTGRAVWIGYVDETGRTTRRLLEPITLSGGRLTAVEVGRPGTRTFSVHRVTGVAVAAEVEG
jgi:hypothetical protein